jgi:hypothetical protein
MQNIHLALLFFHRQNFSLLNLGGVCISAPIFLLTVIIDTWIFGPLKASEAFRKVRGFYELEVWLRWLDFRTTSQSK